MKDLKIKIIIAALAIFGFTALAILDSLINHFLG